MPDHAGSRAPAGRPNLPGEVAPLTRRDSPSGFPLRDPLHTKGFEPATPGPPGSRFSAELLKQQRATHLLPLQCPGFARFAVVLTHNRPTPHANPANLANLRYVEYLIR